MRKLLLTLAIGLLATTAGIAANPRPVTAATYQAKVVIVVGQVQGVTASYKANADAIAAVAARYTTNVVKVYSPNATWARVKAAAAGANIFIYLGHGNGYPDPYLPYLQPKANNGMGLDGGSGSSTTYYYGEAYMAQLHLAPNSIVILNHLCYASGNSEPGLGRPSISVAHTRIEGYAGGFLRGGARAVIAEALNDISYYITTLFTGHTTVNGMWHSAPSYHGTALATWDSTRNPGYTAESDPDVNHPNSDGDYYYRSMVGLPGLTTDQVVTGQFATFTPQASSYYKLSPIKRVVDARWGREGPTGHVLSGGGVYYQIAGVDGIPANAVAVTANVTITGQTHGGWAYVGPSVDSTPGSSTINFPAGNTRANGVTVALTPEGELGFYYSGGSGSMIDVIIDVSGYFLAGSGGALYNGSGPARIMDTRAASRIGTNTTFAASHHQLLTIAGQGGLPAKGIVAVAGNVTVVRPTNAGFVFLGPDPTDAPSNSTINFPAGDVRANNFIVPVAADGTLSVVYITSNSTGTTDVLVDITGYFTTSGGALYNTISPYRVLDSRTPIPSSVSMFRPNIPQQIHVTGTKVPAGAAGVSGNLTVAEQTSNGYASVGPNLVAPATFSNLNFPRGDIRANGATVPLATDGTLGFLSSCSADLIFDITGYYSAP
jgi:hypothetical protein